MRKIKIKLVILSLIASIGLILTGLIFAQETSSNSLQGKIIALDAGHGGDKLGAQYPPTCADDGDPSDCAVYEKDVNLAVVYTLKEKLEESGANVILTRECDETISSNKDRVDLAVEKCQSQYGRKCDVLVSVHHNGSIDPAYDGTLVIYNESQDIPLAVALHDALIAGLELPDEGYLHGGYGMTVFDRLVSALTEAYYITNTQEADYYLAGISTAVCQNDGADYPVFIGDRVNQETQSLYDGLVYYFNNLPSKPGKGK